MNSFWIFLIVVLALTKIEGRDIFLPIPKNIPYSKSKALLGKRLFFDANLSSNGSISCSTCHSPINGADNKPYSITGLNINTPTIFNSIFNFKEGWSGEVKSLKESEFLAKHISKRMKASKRKIEYYLRRNLKYRLAFKEIYGKRANFQDMLDALVEFEKSLITPDAKFDKFLRREDNLTELEFKGYKLFKRLGCATCHNGINIGGNSYQKIGSIYPYIWIPNSPDRYSITKREEDKNVYRVPTLRNITLTAPYFHDGSAKTLKEAIQKMAYYNLGMRILDSELEPLVAFLKTLTGKKPHILKEAN